jgi:hypothetical protein
MRYAPIAAAILLSVGLLLMQRTTAADMGVTAAPTKASVTERAAIEAHLERTATLLLVRSIFDVTAAEEVAGLLRQERRYLEDFGITEVAAAKLDADLLAEGSYFIVSLKYLALVGGAIWPEDRAATAYTEEALIELDVLQRELTEAVQTRADPLPIMQRIDRVYWWTEGYDAVPAGGHFGGRDQLVEQSMR